MMIDTSPIASMQRSLRQCLSHMAAMLYHHGHVLETVSVPHRGLDRREAESIASSTSEWQTCEKVLVNSEAASWNEHNRLVLTPLGRELLFDMFGEGAADCA
ncbi:MULTISPECIES: hypothetical protein [Halomonas]|jgi:hypothetical protein|uniref:Uncharacterized protein n=1 Tax=Halomonas mongoliensis TaxID=321265 RepID=A0ABU1GLH7_9GAMM|nr:MULTISPECIES: hypothetical protein [Halomonas]MDR5892871.1 hypothetical protein [Halomonas mongoliensis]